MLSIVEIDTQPLFLFICKNMEAKGIMAPRKKAIPEGEVNVKEIPETDQTEKSLPNAEMPVREMPQVGNPENTVIIGGELIEIKPTKLIYQRNRTAVFYHALELYPLPDLLAMENSKQQDMFGNGRDGDKALLDWLVALTDREDLVREHYNEIDTDMVYRLLEIFRRVNKIDEREAKLKNALTPGARA